MSDGLIGRKLTATYYGRVVSYEIGYSALIKLNTIRYELHGALLSAADFTRREAARLVPQGENPLQLLRQIQNREISVNCYCPLPIIFRQERIRIDAMENAKKRPRAPRVPDAHSIGLGARRDGQSRGSRCVAGI
jgi:hypothetical protein